MAGLAISGIVALSLVIAGWYYYPLYGFLAHRGMAPFGPFGWVEMPEGDAPQTFETLDPVYTEAGEDAIRRLAAWRARIGAPALSAAVAIDGELVWRGAVGWSHLDARTPVTPETRFRIGSTSKAVTATALARLVDRGVIDLDAPISRYADDLPNEAWNEMTARQLASHMAGLPHYRDNSDPAGRRETTALNRHYANVADALDIFDESDLLFEPGTTFFYSSLGTTLLGAVMGEASGQSYRDLVRQQVLDPIGMTETRVAEARPASDSAQFYYREEDRYRVWRAADLSQRLPGGGWASTPSDLVRLGAMWLDEDYISPETRNLFWTPQRLADGAVNEQNYALGWRWREWDVEGLGTVRNANHGGVSRGSQSFLIVLPDHDMVIAVNVNMTTDPFWDFGAVYEELFREFAAN